MAYQITLSDDDYAALQAASQRTGEPIEPLLHEAITIGTGRSAPVFVCADAQLLTIASAEGLAIENPTTHP